MNVIFKYHIPVQDQATSIKLPEGSKVRFIGVQNGEIYLWTEEPRRRPIDIEIRHFLVVGTGHSFDSRLTYIGSVQIGPFVWHVLECS